MKYKFAFTLSEVLITLAIIGVTAAITIPNVISNYQKQGTENHTVIIPPTAETTENGAQEK